MRIDPIYDFWIFLRILRNLMRLLGIFSDLMFSLENLYFGGKLRWDIGLGHYVRMNETVKKERRYDRFRVLG